jgi:hypothetical protein
MPYAGGMLGWSSRARVLASISKRHEADLVDRGRRQDLQRDLAAEWVLDRAIDNGHAARGQALDDLVVPQGGSAQVPHGGSKDTEQALKSSPGRRLWHVVEGAAVGFLEGSRRGWMGSFRGAPRHLGIGA